MARGPAQPREIGYGASAPTWWATLSNEQTPELRWPLSVRVYDAMRSQDAQVVSTLKAVMLPVLSTKWRIDPAGASDEVVNHVAADLNLPVLGGDTEPPMTQGRRNRLDWSTHQRHALLSLPFGHMFFEQLYRFETDGKMHLRKLGPRMPQTISSIVVADDGGLESIEQWSPIGSRGTVKIPVTSLVAYVNELEGGNWLGRSLLRAAYKNWLIKDRLLRVQAQSIERNGMGIPIYTASEKERDLADGEAVAMGVRAGDTAGAAIPNGALLELLGINGTLPDADKPIRYHDEQIARSVLAHFLNLGTQTGSWALGQTFVDFFTLSLRFVADQLANVGTQHVIWDLVDINYGEDEPAPRLVYDTIGADQAPTAQAIAILLQWGAIHPDAALESYLREHLGLPDFDPANAMPSQAVPMSVPAEQPA